MNFHLLQGWLWLGCCGAGPQITLTRRGLNHRWLGTRFGRNADGLLSSMGVLMKRFGGLHLLGGRQRAVSSRRRGAYGLSISLVTLMVAGCNASPVDPAMDQFIGTVLTNTASQLIVQVDSGAEASRDDPRVEVHVAVGAKIVLYASQQTPDSASVQDIAVGDRLRVYSNGQEMRSLLPQVVALRLDILR